MAYVDATAADLKAAFPSFIAVADETINFWLDRARRSVDTTWTEGDYAMGQMLLAAHYLTLIGMGTGAEAEIAANGATGFKSIKSGSLSLERFESGSAGATGVLSGTSYGQQYVPLARVNVGGPRVVPTGTVDYGPYAYPQGEF